MVVFVDAVVLNFFLGRFHFSLRSPFLAVESREKLKCMGPRACMCFEEMER